MVVANTRLTETIEVVTSIKRLHAEHGDSSTYSPSVQADLVTSYSKSQLVDRSNNRKFHASHASTMLPAYSLTLFFFFYF